MLSQEKRELLIRTYEKTHDANLTAEIFCVNRSTVYARVKEYKETGSTELHTSQRGRKRKITTEDDERIKKWLNHRIRLILYQNWKYSQPTDDLGSNGKTIPK